MQAHDDALDTIEQGAVIDLINRAWVLFAEWDLGHRDEGGVRAELAAMVLSADPGHPTGAGAPKRSQVEPSSPITATG